MNHPTTGMMTATTSPTAGPTTNITRAPAARDAARVRTTTSEAFVLMPASSSRPARPRPRLARILPIWSVAQTLDLNDEVDRGRDLLTDGPQRQVHACHEDERLESGDGVAGSVRVDR